MPLGMKAKVGERRNTAGGGVRGVMPTRKMMAPKGAPVQTLALELRLQEPAAMGLTLPLRDGLLAFCRARGAE